VVNEAGFCSKEEIQKRREESEKIRQDLMKKYQSPDRWMEMSFDEKRKLLKKVFDSKDHGVFVRSKDSIQIAANVLGTGEPMKNYINKMDQFVVNLI
jgi:epoxyqueuosine reductase QueG